MQHFIVFYMASNSQGTVQGIGKCSCDFFPNNQEIRKQIAVGTPFAADDIVITNLLRATEEEVDAFFKKEEEEQPTQE